LHLRGYGKRRGLLGRSFDDNDKKSLLLASRSAFEARVGFDFKVAEMELLSYLLRQATIPEYQMRLRWQPDTLVIWDNRSTQHYAIQDYFPAVRRMMRATVTGDRPR